MRTQLLSLRRSRFLRYHQADDKLDKCDDNADSCYYNGRYQGFGRIILYDPGVHPYADGIDDGSSYYRPHQRL